MLDHLRAHLSEGEKRKVDAARTKAFLLYEGKVTPHRSCGIALAETFNLPTRPYQALRRGGLTGEGECGAIKAGELILGEFLGDPDPTGAPTPLLREAAQVYRQEWIRRVDRGPKSRPGIQHIVEFPDIICNHLTAPWGEFSGADRQRFCTNIAAQVAEIVAEILLRAEADFDVKEIEPIR